MQVSEEAERLRTPLAVFFSILFKVRPTHQKDAAVPLAIH